MRTGIKAKQVFRQTNDLGNFSPPRRHSTIFQLGSAVENEMNAHRLVPFVVRLRALFWRRKDLQSFDDLLYWERYLLAN